MIHEFIIFMQIIGWTVFSFFVIVSIISFIILVWATCYKITQFICRIMHIQLSWPQWNSSWLIEWKNNRGNSSE